MQSPESSFQTARGRDAENLIARTEQYAREEPLKTVGVAFGAGLILTLLPVGAIVVAVVRLTLSLLRPALLILGAIKLYEEIDQRRNE